MNVLYLTRNYEYVQPRIIEALNRKEGVRACGLYYYFSFRTVPESFPQNVSHISCPFLLSRYISAVIAFFLVVGRCLKICRQQKIDVIHCNMTFFDGHIARLCGKLLGIRYVISFRETDETYLDLFTGHLLKRSSERIFRDAQAVVFLSYPYRERLLSNLSEAVRELTEKKAYVIPNGVDAFFWNNRSIHDRHTGLKLIFIGKINKRKNPEALIEAIAGLSGKYAVELNLVGELVDEEYRQMIADNPCIRYHSVCDYPKILTLLRESDILVVPSHKESFGLVYPEAMTQGLPVIYSRGEGFDGNFRQGEIGYAVDPNDPADIADKIEKIYENYETLSGNSYEKAKRFSWDLVADSLIAIYE